MIITNIKKDKTRKAAGSNGVALIVVLSLISLLFLMAVAFAIQMRIERSGASAYRNSVVARHMVWSGLASAINDINNMMTTNGASLPYPSRDVLVSDGNVDVQVLSGAAIVFVPSNLWADVRSMKAKSSNITFDRADQVIGKYAYIIVNQSGCLDASMFNGSTNRSKGLSINELQLDHVVTDKALFKGYVDSDIRYETLPELFKLNLGVKPSDQKNFSVFSIANTKESWSGVSNATKAFFGGNPNAWNKPDIKAALVRAKVANPDEVLNNMIDYADTDYVPQKLDQCCGEPVPMINKFVIEYCITRVDVNTCRIDYTNGCQWFYPFIKNSSQTFDLSFTAKSAVLPPPQNSYLAAIPTASITASGNINSPAATNRGYISDSKSANVANATNPVAVGFTVEFKGDVKWGAQTVDQVPYPAVASTPWLKVSVKIPSMNINVGDTVYTNAVIECLDPRFNHTQVCNGQQYWLDSAAGRLVGIVYPSRVDRLGINEFTKYCFAQTPGNILITFDSEKYAPEAFYNYVANEPFKSAGELGLICTEPWSTIRLLDRGWPSTKYAGPNNTPYHKVLDCLTVATNIFKRGLVNPNTTNLDVLATVFLDVPSIECQTDLPMTKMTWANACALGTSIMNSRPFTNLSDLGKSSINWTNWVNPSVSDIVRESAIRNSVEILSPRQNYFMVIMRADSFAQQIGDTQGRGRSLATARAIAELWRDPFPDAQGRHKSFVRFFRYLED